MKIRMVMTPYKELAALRRRENLLQKQVDELDESLVFHPEKLSTLEKTLNLLMECRETIERFVVIHKLQT
jgi:hypothetical protein